jgi:uncharacterized protein YodC (DUF2158 family)
MAKFKPGDVVHLKSGSPPMTVKSYFRDVGTLGSPGSPGRPPQEHEDQLVCEWFDQNMEPKQRTFPETSLVLAEPEPNRSGSDDWMLS